MKRICLLSIITFVLLLMPHVYAAELKTGTYKIRNANDESKILVENDGNIELGDDDSTGVATWDVYSGGSYFSIKSSGNSSKSITVQTGTVKNGLNVSLGKHVNNNYHKFKLVQAEDKNYYYIRSLLGNYNLDAKGASTNIGTNIQLYTHNGTGAQKWKFERIDESQKPVEDGTYIVKAANNTNNALDLYGASTKNSTNIQVYSNNFTYAQLWNIRYENGYYTITTTLDNNKCIDINGAKLVNGSNVQLYQKNGSIAQKWIIERNGDNTYSFSSYDGFWRMDVYDNSKSSGANIHLYQANGSLAQKFYIEKSSIEPLQDGYYTIDSLLGTDMVVGINNSQVISKKNVILTKKTDNNYSKWYIKRIKDDIYTIANAGNKKIVLDVYGGYTDDRTNVWLYKKNGSDAQKWRIRKNGDNTYTLIGLGSRKVLDVNGAYSTEGTNIQIYTSNSSKAQKFNITPTTAKEYEIIENGKYVIKSRVDQNKVVDVYSGYKDNNTNVWVYSANSTNAQIWKVENIGDGEYVIRSMLNPRIVLTASSSNVVVRKYDGSDVQKWYFMSRGEDGLVLYNLGTGAFLNFDGTDVRSNISLTTTQSNKNEIVLSSYTNTLKYRGVDLSSHNGDVNWDVLKTKVDFVVIRAGYSSEVLQNGKDKYQDTKFLRNVEYCEKYNIPYALYLYSYAMRVEGDENSAVSEADHMIKLLNKAKQYGSPNLSVPVYYDLEDKMTYNAVNYDAETLTKINDRFCSIMEKKGYQCGLYTFLNGFGYMGYDNVRMLASKYGIWVAYWYWYDFEVDEDQFPAKNSNNNGFEQRYSYKPKIWQFSSEGNIPAANTGSGKIDLNIGYDIFE